MGFMKVAMDADVKNGQMKAVFVNGQKIVVARAANTLYAFDSACTHRGAPLQDGSLSGTTVTCPLHGGQFDLTSGEATAPPVMRPIRTYPVKSENGEIWVDA